MDSDLDGSRNLGAQSNQRTAGYSGTTTGNNIGSNTGTHGGISHSTNAGPHNSNLANKVSTTTSEAAKLQELPYPLSSFPTEAFLRDT